MRLAQSKFYLAFQQLEEVTRRIIKASQLGEFNAYPSLLKRLQALEHTIRRMPIDQDQATQLIALQKTIAGSLENILQHDSLDTTTHQLITDLVTQFTGMDKQRNKLEIYLKELDRIIRQLPNKEDRVYPRYITVGQAATKLQNALLDAFQNESNLFNTTVTAAAVDEFKTTCIEAVLTAEEHFNDHRAWTHLKPTLEKITQCVAALHFEPVVDIDTPASSKPAGRSRVSFFASKTKKEDRTDNAVDLQEKDLPSPG